MPRPWMKSAGKVARPAIAPATPGGAGLAATGEGAGAGDGDGETAGDGVEVTLTVGDATGRWLGEGASDAAGALEQAASRSAKHATKGRLISRKATAQLRRRYDCTRTSPAT